MRTTNSNTFFFNLKLGTGILFILFSLKNKAQCNADFTIEKGAYNNEYVLSAIHTGSIQYYKWDLGDGITDSINSVIHHYNQTKIYHVCLSIYDADKKLCSTVCKDIANDVSTCKALFSTSISENRVIFNASPSGFSNNAVLFWDYGDGNTSKKSSWLGSMYEYADTGAYHACLKVMDTISGCESTFCDDLKFNKISCSLFLNAYFDYTSTDHHNYILSIYSQNRKRTYSIDFGDGTSQSNIKWPVVNEIRHSYPNPGMYHACIQLNDTDHNCSLNACTDINVPTCFADFTYTLNAATRTCFLYPAHKDNTSIYEWSFSDGVTQQTSSLPEPSFQYVPGKSGYARLIISSTADATCHDTVYQKLTLPVGIQKYESSLLSLENYPNPFSKQTTIRYALSKSAAVEISVYDLLGNKIETLSSEIKAAGHYSLEWNSGNLSKGMYLLQLKTGEQQLTRKMMINE
jgi:PKD repeat protein